MPISVLCPECDAPVNAPDSAAGKRAKCPKCGGVMILPGGEEEAPPPDEEPAPRRRRQESDDDDLRPSRRSSRDEADDDDRPSRRRSREKEDDDEDYDDRPRRRSRKPKKKAAPPAAALAFGTIVAIASGVFTFWLFNRQPALAPINPQAAFNQGPLFGNPVAPPAIVGPKAATPAGWVTFNEPAGRFTAAMPRQPQNIQLPAMLINPRVDEMKIWQCQAADGVTYQALYQTFKQLPPGEPPPTFLDQCCDQFAREVITTMGQEIGRTEATLGGFRAKEMKFVGVNSATVRFSFANRKIFAVCVVTPAGAFGPIADASAYFDNFQPK